MKKSILFRLLFVFLFMMAGAALFTFTGAYILSSHQLNREALQDQATLARTVIAYAESSTEDTLTITKRFSNMLYNIEALPYGSEPVAELSREELQQLEGGDVVFRRSTVGFTAHTLFSVRGDFFQITLTRDNNLVRRFIFQLGLSLSVVVLFTMLLSYFALKKMLRPLYTLTKATERVAKGDFDFRLNISTMEEINILTNSFNKMLSELKSNELLRSDFIRNVSHEFKTPLATIQGFAKLINAGQCTPEEQQEYAKIIESESQRLAVLCNNILRLSRIENQQIVARNTKYPLDEQLRDAILLLEQQWTEKELALEIELEETDIISDEELLQQVWMNLLGNAIKFTPAGGQIGVTLTVQDALATVIISDTGIGMTPEVVQHIFDKFYQGDRSHASQGNGLGLTIVRQIVQLCQGTITVSSEPDKGSTFTVTLPLSPEEAPEKHRVLHRPGGERKGQ